MEINKPHVIAELSEQATAYEQALVNNDVEALQSYFWQSPSALRFGVAEELHGADEISHFRATRKINFTDRRTVRTTVTSFGDDFGVTTLEFTVVAGKKKYGRQTQVWVRLDGQWAIVSAHVSHKVVPTNVAEAFTDATSNLLSMNVAPQYAEGVVSNVEAMAKIAAPLMAFELDDNVEPAAVFKP